MVFAKYANEYASDVIILWHLWTVNDQGETAAVQALKSPTHWVGTRVESGGAFPEYAPFPTTTLPAAHMASFCRESEMTKYKAVGGMGQHALFPFSSPSIRVCLTNTFSPAIYVLIYSLLKINHLIVKLKWSEAYGI